VDELVKVYKEYGADYDREKAYAEEIDVKIEEGRKKINEQAEKREAKAAGGKGATGATQQISMMGGPTESVGGKTGKIN